MARYGCGTDASGVNVLKEFRQPLVEWLCPMLLGDFLLGSFLNLVFQTMQLGTVLQAVVIHCRETASDFMGM